MLDFKPCRKIAAGWPFNHVAILALIGSVPHPIASCGFAKEPPKKRLARI